jgi:hypothetical protein
LLSPTTNTHIFTGLEKWYSDLRQHAENLADDLEYVSAVAREAAEEREARLSQLEERCHSLVVLLEKVIARTGTRISGEDQGVMEQLEQLEEQMGRFGEKLSSPVLTPTSPVKDWPTPIRNYNYIHPKTTKSLYPHRTSPDPSSIPFGFLTLPYTHQA